jgi:hypothetical protein
LLKLGFIHLGIKTQQNTQRSHSGLSPQTNEKITITKSLEIIRLRAETESVPVSKIYREEKQALLKSKNTFLRNENLF